MGKQTRLHSTNAESAASQFILGSDAVAGLCRRREQLSERLAADLDSVEQADLEFELARLDADLATAAELLAARVTEFFAVGGGF